MAVLFLSAGVPWYLRLSGGRVLAGSVLLACVGMGFVSLRWGHELLIHYRVEGKTLWRGRGSREAPLLLDTIESIDWRGPFADGPIPWPAWILIDSEHRGHRISAWVRDGDQLLEVILKAADNPTLGNWADAKKIRVRIGRVDQGVAFSYLLILVPLLWLWMGWR